MTRDELKIRTQQAIDAIPTLSQNEHLGWGQMRKILCEILLELDDSDWHTGTPTEEGWYLVAYKCVHECKNKGKIEYHSMNIVTYEDGFKDFRGMASDDVWQAIAYQEIEPYKETD